MVFIDRRTDYILKFAKPYTFWFIFSFICILITSIISIIYPYIYSVLIDEVFYTYDFKMFISIIILYSVLFILEQSFHFILNLIWIKNWNSFLFNIRSKVFDKLLSLRYKDISNISIGNMINKINNESEAFLELLLRNYAYLILNTLRLLLSLYFIFNINKILFCISLVTVFFSYTMSYILGKKIGIKQKNINNEYGNFLGWIFEIIVGIRDIKLLNAQSQINKLFFSKYIAIVRKKIVISNIELFSDRINTLINIISDTMLYIVSGILIVKNEITIGNLIAILSYYNISYNMLKGINKFWNKIHNNYSNIDRIIEILDKEDEGEEDKLKSDIAIKNGKILFCNVSFSYNHNNLVLKNLNLKISKGEHIAIAGKSGSGKSTIVNLLLKLLNPCCGNIYIDGIDISNIKAQSIREQIGIVQQDIFIFDGTIRSNLLLAKKDATDEEIMEACKKSEIKEYIDSLKDGLDTVIGSYGIGLSGGEKQRLAIARLFLKNPQILIFDEATASLDYVSEVNINKTWKALMKERTCITIAHRLSSIKDADKIILIDNGCICAEGSHEELFNGNSSYRNLVKEQYINEMGY